MAENKNYIFVTIGVNIFLTACVGLNTSAEEDKLLKICAKESDLKLNVFTLKHTSKTLEEMLLEMDGFLSKCHTQIIISTYAPIRDQYNKNKSGVSYKFYKNLSMTLDKFSGHSETLDYLYFRNIIVEKWIEKNLPKFQFFGTKREKLDSQSTLNVILQAYAIYKSGDSIPLQFLIDEELRSISQQRELEKKYERIQK